MKKLFVGLYVIVALLIANEALAIEADKRLHFAVGATVGASASVFGHVLVAKSLFEQWWISMGVMSPIYVGKELADTKFDWADLGYDYAGHTAGFWLMQPVNRLFFGESARDKALRLSITDDTVMLNLVVGIE